jgi:starch synthase
MRIALISFARRGGMVHFQAELANALARVTPVVAVCVADVPATYFAKKATRLVVDAGQGAVGSLVTAANPLTWYRILRSLRQTEADVFHVVAAHEWNPILALMAKMLRKPLVYTVHDPVPHRGAPLRMRISNALVTNAADAVVVLTKYGRTQLLARGFEPKKVFVIPLGVYSLFARRRRNGTRPEDLILFFGRVEPYKGLQVLISAFSSVCEALPDWKLLIAGTGSLPESIERIDPERIEVLNRYVSDDEAAGMMRRARLVILPYLEATQSAVVATAYAFGKPVIVTRVGGLPEMVIHGKTGLVVPANDPKALARAMKTLAGDRSRLKRMGRLARSVSQERWPWDKIARMHISMYKAMLKGRRVS